MDSFNPFIEKIIWYLLLVFVITVHEWAHAWSANKCGDPTARLMGRMTWNPLPHMDIIGTVAIPLLMLIMPGTISLIGWGKPVPVNPHNFRHSTRDDVIVSFAGPASNLIMTLSALVLMRIALLSQTQFGALAAEVILQPLALMAFFLGFFNLIPLPPLDGSHLLRPLLGFKARQVFDQISRYSFIILLLLINLRILDPFFNLVFHLYALLYKVVGIPV
jgi:Zn-dependent protease